MRRVAIGAVTFLLSPPAFAHIPLLRGRLVDDVRHSDVIVVGTVDRVVDVAPRTTRTTITVERTLFGSASAPLTFDGSARFVAGRRYVFFIRREGDDRLQCVQASGVIFPSRPEDDAAYAQAVAGIRAALQANEAARPKALRAALIPALRAGEPALRYHAALELAGIAHHGALNADERQQIEAIAANPATDPKLKPLLAMLLKESRQ